MDTNDQDNKNALQDLSADVLALDASHAYSTVQLVVETHAAATIRQRAATIIAPEHVHPAEGLESRPHITVLYGLETADVADILPCVTDSPMMEAVIQGLEVFSPDGKDYDVLVHRVACPGAQALHDRLCTLPHVSTHPVYMPHLTLGYVQRGVGAQYALLQTGLEGMVLRFPSLEFNSQDDVRTTIPLRQEASLALEAMGVHLPAMTDHPNRLAFEGVLTRVDEASDRAPAGAQGHRVLLPRPVAEAALPSLIGMGVGIALGLEGHNPQRKIGVITEAWLAGQDLRVRGVLYARDFPTEIAHIRTLARQGLMGMSFELAAVEIVESTAPIWHIQRCTFTGAAILKRHHAAYTQTTLAAQAQRQGGSMQEDTLDPTPEVVTLVASAEDVATLQANMDSLMQTMQQMGGMLEGYQASMDAMSRCVGMRAELDGLVEALEHLVKMHEALHTVLPAASGEAVHGEGETMDAESRTRLEKVEASMLDLAAAVKLLTDGQQEIKGLITDRQQGAQGLLTDSAGRMAANGRSWPQRRTMAAQGEYERCVAKYGLEASKGYSEREIDTILKNAGVTDTEKRLAVKLEMEACGVMQRA